MGNRSVIVRPKSGRGTGRARATIQRSGALRFLPAAAALALFCPSGAAQGAKDPAAVALLDHAAGAAGAPPGRVSTLRASGTRVATDGGKVPFRVSVEGADIRWEFDTAEGLVSVDLNLDSGRGSRGKAERVQPLRLSQEACLGLERLPILGLGRWIQASANRASLLQAVQEGGKEYDRVEVSRTEPAGSKDRRRAVEEATRSELFLDRTGGLPAKVRCYSHPGDWRVEIPIDLVFSDYRRVQGVLWPFRAAAFYEKTPLWDLIYESVSFGQGGAK